jgi:Tfp pilus assembly protein PilO
MTKKIVLTILVIAALLVAIYKWIMSSDDNEETVQETSTEEVKEPANNEKENVNGKAEEATEDKVNETINK